MPETCFKELPACFEEWSETGQVVPESGSPARLSFAMRNLPDKHPACNSAAHRWAYIGNDTETLAEKKRTARHSWAGRGSKGVDAEKSVAELVISLILRAR